MRVATFNILHRRTVGDGVGPRFVAAISALQGRPGWRPPATNNPGPRLRPFVLRPRLESAPVAGPRLLAGDLNLTPSAVRRWSGMRPLAMATTFPAPAPDRQLDHILTDDRQLRGGPAGAVLMPISDHRPLVVAVARA